ncbi:hypothetical protein Pelo_18706 [Pelomyxa schiedti]|nr:hypothetical protein Pelo_18706 [Pelomyxa schiedti]
MRRLRSSRSPQPVPTIRSTMSPPSTSVGWGRGTSSRDCGSACDSSSSSALLKSSTTSSPGRRCYVSMIPHWVVAELIGKRWVMGTDRVVLITLVGGPIPQPFRVFFSVSHTLGILQNPELVSLDASTLGWITPVKCVTTNGICDEDPDWPLMQLPSDLKELVRFRLAVCNRKWVVQAPYLHSEVGILEVLALHNGGDEEVVPPQCVEVKCPWNPTALQSLRFFSSSSEYDTESDTLEVFFVHPEGDGEALIGMHIDLNIIVEEGAINSAHVVVKLKLDEETENLCTPLFHRAEKKYYLPFTSEKNSQMLLDLSTGISHTWLEDSTGLEVRALDESHLSITTADHSSTSVFSVQSLVNQTNIRAQCITTHQHPPGTLSVVSGCGLLACSSISSAPVSTCATSFFRSELESTQFHPTATACLGTSYSTACLRLVGKHTVVDALSGAQLFTLTFPHGFLPNSITPIPFKTPALLDPDRGRWTYLPI